MRLKIVIPLLILLPLLGCGLGYAWADTNFKGALVRWQALGNPNEAIGGLLGIHNGSALVVETVTGKLYEAEFDVTRPSRETFRVR